MRKEGEQQLIKKEKDITKSLVGSRKSEEGRRTVAQEDEEKREKKKEDYRGLSG